MKKYKIEKYLEKSINSLNTKKGYTLNKIGKGDTLNKIWKGYILNSQRWNIK